MGSALSGAVFGGPEAAIGGLVGGLAGGIAGGAAGAGLGAQASMLRQSLAGTADYAAQIGKLQIALRGVAGSQEQFTKAMRAAADVTKTLNIPQETAISGMTRLSAAIRGAGGNVTDAEVVFRNVTQAIKATGGSAEDVQSAITAMVQVFSKGKVSAEEISGQLGERLPGAVTLFAKANEMSLIDLQKALKAGTVGLNELMNFVDELGKRYGKTSGTIAKSSEDAGARLTVSINNMRLAVGKALQPIGAEFQDAFGQFINEITPALVSSASAVSTAIKVLADNFRSIVNIAGFIAVLTGVNYALKALAALSGPVKAFFLLLQAHFGAASAQAVAAQAKFKAFALTVKALAAALAPTIVISVALVGGAIVLNWLERIKKAKQGLIDKQNAPVGESFLKSIGGDAATKSTIRRNLADINTAYDEYTRTIKKRGERLNKLYTEQRLLQQGGFVTAQAAKGLQTKIDVLQAEQDEDLKAYTNLQKNREALERRLASAPDDPRTNFAALTGDDDGGKGKLLMTQQELLLRRQIREAALKENDLAKAVATYRLDVLEANKETKDELARQNMLEEANLKFQQTLLEYKDKQIEKEKELKRITSDINYDFKQRQYELGLISKEQFVQTELAREEERLREQLKDKPAAEREVMVTKGVELKRRELDPSFKEAAETDLVLMERQLENMLKPLNQLKGAAEAFGSSLTNAFNSVITGQASVKQALAGFLKDLGQYFLEYTAKVITQMIVIATIQAAIKALGGPSTGPGGESGGKVDPLGPLLNPQGVSPAAQGVALDKGIKRYAMGGVVNKPTMFTYAEGGVGRYGLMGEAGAEAIIPLKRGNDGRLGVSLFADTNDAVKAKADKAREAAFTENNEALAESSSYMRERTIEREQQTMLTGAGGTALVQTQVINSVEYATVDQLNAAAAQSAKKARAEVFAEMRNKPSVRKSLGMR